MSLTLTGPTISVRSVTVAFAAWDREVEVRAFPHRVYADVAQLVERPPCKRLVRRSIRRIGFFYFETI